MAKITVHLPDGEVLVFPLHKDNGEDFHLRVGRSPDCDIVIPLSSVSGDHAVLSKTSYGYVLRDSGSTNGLIVNGGREDSVVLAPDVKILVGEAVFGYELDPEDAPGQGTPPSEVLPVADSDDADIPDLEPLHYDGNEEEDEEDEDEVKTVRVISKSYILIAIIYTIVVFALAFAAGVIYKHYTETRELLPYKWLGIESQKEKITSEFEAQKRAAAER